MAGKSSHIPTMVIHLPKTCPWCDPLFLYAGNEFVPQEIPRKEVTKDHGTLGISLNPTISFESEVEYHKGVSNKIASHLRHGTAWGFEKQ